MYDKDFTELVKIAVEKLKEDTVYKMLTRSEDYQKESDARDKAERKYENLDLTMEQRMICNVFLDYRDRQSLEYSDYSYLAGLYDAFRIMAVIFPNRIRDNFSNYRPKSAKKSIYPEKEWKATPTGYSNSFGQNYTGVCENYY